MNLGQVCHSVRFLAYLILGNQEIGVWRGKVNTSWRLKWHRLQARGKISFQLLQLGQSFDSVCGIWILKQVFCIHKKNRVGLMYH